MPDKGENTSVAKEKFVLLQPTFHGGVDVSNHRGWTNDPFISTAKCINAPMYNINDNNIPTDRDIYWFVNFAISDMNKEIVLMEKLKNSGKKIFLSFSHDMRFLIGDGLLNADGYLFTELCRLADAIGGGVSNKYKIFGRYQHKVIDFGDILFDINFSKPFNNRSIDLLMSGPIGEQFLSIGLEALLTVKERHPNIRVVCLVRRHHHELVDKLRNNYPQIEYQIDGPLIEYLKDTKVYYNPEPRPRPGRAMMESYYCRVPFISCASTYFSRICEEFSYCFPSAVDVADIFDKIMSSNIDTIISTMEEKAKYDFFEPIYNRIITNLK